MTVCVIPMAGAGSRFAREGYTVPKYAIEAHGRSLLARSLESLPLADFSRVVLVAQRAQAEQVDPLSVLTPEQACHVHDVILIDALTRGQAATVLAARRHIGSAGLLVYNCDTAFVSPGLAERLKNPALRLDGVLGAFRGAGTHWSFARTDADGIVTETAEKVRISDNCLTGLYHFSNGEDFIDAYERTVVADGQELYVAPMYNALIGQGRRFVLDFVSEFSPLGTPLELQQFERT